MEIGKPHPVGSTSPASPTRSCLQSDCFDFEPAACSYITDIAPCHGLAHRKYDVPVGPSYSLRYTIGSFNIKISNIKILIQLGNELTKLNNFFVVSLMSRQGSYKR